ncbi:MAG: hypothetical protein ACRC4N_18125 [Gammaproteobacteria bacterium]
MYVCVYVCVYVCIYLSSYLSVCVRGGLSTHPCSVPFQILLLA